MASFFIECPICKRNVQANTGVFAKKKIRCACGYDIQVSAERITKEICPHCGNEVVYDKKNAASATCSVCHKKIHSSGKMVTFTCPSCKMKLEADASTKEYTCPQCNVKINVQARVAQEQSSRKTSLIEWDQGQNDVFVYRHPVENFNIGSRLIVREGQKAIFFRNGRGLDLFGPGDYILETQKLPLMDQLFQLPTDANVTFSSNVYFIKTNPLKVRWGVPEIRLRNPGMNFYVEIGMRGSFELQVKDDDISARNLVYKIIGTSSGFKKDIPLGGGEIYNVEYITEKFSDIVNTRLSDLMAEIIINNGINVLDIETKKIVISDYLRQSLNPVFDDYGLTIPANLFSLTHVIIHNSKDVEKWRQQEADRVLGVRDEEVRREQAQAAQSRILLEEETTAKKAILHTEAAGLQTRIKAGAQADATRISAAAEAEAIKLSGQAGAQAYSAQAFAEAEEMRAKGYTYQQETSRIVGQEAMKNGLPGTGSGGSSATGGLTGMVGDMMGLGMSLGVMGSAMNVAKDAINPIISGTSDMVSGAMPAPQKEIVGAWNCACGEACITSKFCPSCGAAKPVEKNATWDCVCGAKGISSKFCPECGAKRPEEPAVWSCPSCGTKGITSKFCPNCGCKKGE